MSNVPVIGVIGRDINWLRTKFSSIRVNLFKQRGLTKANDEHAVVDAAAGAEELEGV